MTFDPEWLAITRTLHPWLSTEYRQIPLPPPKEIERLIRIQKTRIEKEGLLVPKPGWEEGEEVELMWEKPPIEVSRVQQFWPTARAHGQPGGSPSKHDISSLNSADHLQMLGTPTRKQKPFVDS